MMQDKPTYTPDFNNVPLLLRDRKQWIIWNYVWKEKTGKWDKPPHSPHTGYGCDLTDPEQWVTFDQAIESMQRFNADGIGFSLSHDDDITGGDLDHCFTELGLIPLAQKVLDLAETYAEISPSGDGLRLLWLGKISQSVARSDLGIEMYVGGRYLTITGQHIENTPTDIRPAPRTLELLQAAAAKPKKSSESASDKKQKDFWSKINRAALANIGAWVTDLFPTAKRYPNGAWRVTSYDLKRDLEEDLSIHPNGIKDWGVHDMGDPRNNPGGRTPIDVVIGRGKSDDAIEAARYLCGRLGVTMELLGWQELPSIDPSNHVDIEPADLWAQFEPPVLPQGLLPKIIEDFARVQARLMGSDPAGIAMAALAACGAAIPDRIKLQPKKYDDFWTEAARLWVALVGGVSCKKTPIIRAAVKPINSIDADLFRAYSKAMHEYNQLAAEDKKKI